MMAIMSEAAIAQAAPRIGLDPHMGERLEPLVRSLNRPLDVLDQILDVFDPD